jgi:hypothetical protein
MKLWQITDFRKRVKYKISLQTDMKKPKVAFSKFFKAPKNSEIVEQFKYTETILTHQNSIQEKIKIRLKYENACYNLL